jgi:hypothetical protein
MKRARCGALFLILSGAVVFEAMPGSVQAQERAHQCIYNQYVLTTSPHVCRPHAITYPSYVVGHVERAIYNGALTFGVPYALLLHIAQCESSLNPHAVNGDHYGLFQFLPETFRFNAHRMHYFTGIRVHSYTKGYWNAADSSYVAAFMFADDHHFEWVCQ